DDEDESIFDETAKFIEETNIAFSMINIITPLPGTNLYEKMKMQDRIFKCEWNLFDVEHVCFRLNRLSPENFYNRYISLIKSIYSYIALFRRLHRLWDYGVFISNSKTRFTRGRIIFTLINLLNADILRNYFVLRGLWNSKITSITSLLIALNFYNYSRQLNINIKTNV
ncbi:MAG: hypothetical protein NC908_04920, partial [Candidatus Omnitrophica bacterium]|nr:hypothetical protein [Candidatus Omnitrophota bacterium]